MKNTFLITVVLLGLTLIGCGDSKPKPDSNPKKTKLEQQKENLLSSIDSLTKLIDKEPDRASLYIKRAELWINNRMNIPANHDIEKALELEPENEKYLLAFGNHNTLLNDTRKAKEAWTKCSELFPENISCRIKLAELYFYVQEYEKSVSFSNDILKIDGTNHLAYFFKGMSLLEFGDTVKAIKHFQNSVEYQPDFTRSLEMLASIYAEKNDDLAIDYYKSLLNIQPENKTIYFNMAFYYQKKQNFDKALSFYDLALKLDKSNDGIYYNKGFIYSQLKENDLAIEMFSKAIEQNSNSFVAFFARGYVYELQGENKKAFNDYSTVLLLKPGYPPADDGIERVKK